MYAGTAGERVETNLPRARSDGRTGARIPAARFPFEFAWRTQRRIKYQNSISSGIAILRDSPMVPLLLPLFPPIFPICLSLFVFLSRCLSTSDLRALRALYQRECPHGWRTGVDGNVYVHIHVLLHPGKTTSCRGRDTRLPPGNSLGNVAADRRVYRGKRGDDRATRRDAGRPARTTTGASDPIRTARARRLSDRWLTY